MAEAIEEHSKPKEQRSGGDVHTKTKKKPPIKKKVVRKQRDDDDFISKDDSDDDMAALRAKKRSAPKKEGGSTVPKKPRTDEDKKRALDALAAKQREKREEEERKAAAREKKMKDARDSGVPVWKQLSGRAEDKVAPKSPPKENKPFELPTDARGLVEALRKATVGPDKSTKITRMTMAKIYRDFIQEVVADDALLRDLVAVIRGALSEGQDERIAEGLKRLKAALKLQSER